jgi:hypothetical protein
LLTLSVAGGLTSRGRFCARLASSTSPALIVPGIVGWHTREQLVGALPPAP